MYRYDMDCSDSLDAHQLQNFLDEYAGRPVSEQAVAYIMKMAAAVSKDGSAVTDDDMMVAVATWDSFSSKRPSFTPRGNTPPTTRPAPTE